jgi:broad specificity phosphatase PhoE
MPRIALIRHGQTEWSASGQHTSVTDIDLTDEGVRQAEAIPSLLDGLGLSIRTTLVSPRLRAQRTAQLAGLPDPVVVPELAEWNYGEYEGLTSAQIHETRPGWSIFTDGAPGGETPDQVAVRADKALDQARSALTDGDVALVCHGHISRVLAARWAELAATAGAHLAMSPAAVTVLGVDRGTPIIDHSNVIPFVKA